MAVKHSPPAKNKRSQRYQAVITPTARAPLDCTPLVNQLSEKFDRGPPMEGEAPSRRGGVKSRISRSFSGFLGGYPSKGIEENQGKLKIKRGRSLKKQRWQLPWQEEQEGEEFEVSKDKHHAAFLTKENKSIGSEKEMRIREGLCTYCGGKHPIERCLKRPGNRQGSSRVFPSKQTKA
ncbi:hypothetical protein O181_017586 [Austropuccinia psidii MF-1]|uniref:Uncharacterized protein n=1 Tax=Austropuccinia psidii MF-1 TaxID=1389203 RepID=A0A9Q3C3N6_9BASI|nr:hypothetical protein [Austropuccinia psidii MF-1]